MPRVARKDIHTSYIHVITQGINREKIFIKDKYKNEYLKLLKNELKEKNDIQLLAYCIMDNHTHLLVYNEDIKKWSKIMNKVNTSYGIYYNKNENRVGYVFRDRYYVQPIRDEKHLYTALAYIHKNPIKANLVECMDEYKYSSYLKYKNKNVSEKCVHLLFHTLEYEEMFKLIHENTQDDNIIDVNEGKVPIEEIEEFLNKYMLEFNLNKQQIAKNDFLIMKVVNILKDKYTLNNKEISRLLGIGKNRITNIIKQKKESEGVSLNP